MSPIKDTFGQLEDARRECWRLGDALREVAGHCEGRAAGLFKGLEKLDPSVSTAAAVVHARELGEGEAFATAAHMLQEKLDAR